MKKVLNEIEFAERLDKAFTMAGKGLAEISEMLDVCLDDIQEEIYEIKSKAYEKYPEFEKL